MGYDKRKPSPFPAILNLHTTWTCTKLYQSYYISWERKQIELGKEKGQLTLTFWYTQQLKNTPPCFAPEKYHNGLCSVSLELVGGTLPLVYVVVPRRVHWRKLVIIGFQGQSKIRQLWCCLHDSAVKIFQYHSSRNDFPASFHSFIPVMANRHRVKRQNTKERLTFDASIDPGWCEPC